MTPFSGGKGRRALAAFAIDVSCGARGIPQVRSYLPGDLEGVKAVLLAAFGSPVASDDIARMASEPHHIDVAIEDHVVVGVAASTRYGSAAFVGPMAVHPDRQNRGIGRNLLLGLIAGLECQGVTSLALEASKAGIPLYLKHGFVKFDMTHVFERHVDRNAEDDVSVAALPSAEIANDLDSDVAAALRLDAAAYNYNRVAIFRQLVAVNREAKILISDTGYAFARATILGPWVATNPDDAAMLLERALTERPSLERVFVPARNTGAARLLSAAGFTGKLASTHMIRGEARAKREFVYGLISPAFG